MLFHWELFYCKLFFVYIYQALRGAMMAVVAEIMTVMFIYFYEENISCIIG